MNPTYRTDIIKKKKPKKTKEQLAQDAEDRERGYPTDDEYDAATCPNCGHNPHD